MKKCSECNGVIKLRIPQEFVQKYGLKDNEEVSIISEKDGIKIVPIQGK